MIEIIPAIDILGGKCVRLTQGDYARRATYYEDPLDAAQQFEAAGLRRLHLVDLDGAREAFPANLSVLERIASKTGLQVQYGGGIKTAEALDAVFGHGAQRTICGSVAVTDPEAFRQWLGRFGADKIILGADVRNGLVATHGWGSTSQLTAEELIAAFLGDGLRQVICTEIACDGMLCGPAYGLYMRLSERFPALDITASGGVGSMDDIRRLGGTGVRNVIVGKAIYEGRITLNELRQCLQNE